MLNLLPIIFYSNIFLTGLDLVWYLWLWKGGVPTHVLVLISQCHPHHCWVQNTIWMWLDIILIELTRNLYPLYHIDDLFIEIMNPTEKLLHHISWSHDMTMSHFPNWCHSRAATVPDSGPIDDQNAYPTIATASLNL